jgi:hypothetical protein
MPDTTNLPIGPDAVGNRIFEILHCPSKERVRWVRNDCQIMVGDFAWDTNASPENGLIHLTGYNENFLNIWYADFEPQEVRYVGPKPLPPNKPNPFPVRPGINFFR